ncbi:MAG: hypothetical protein KDA84_14270 [Planctomycetaceae bacterium]|nr:hypothetical protein [Planctomycetaceae bacterium]
MTPPENDKPLWTETQVESLLEDFFQKEMPPALRENNPSLPKLDPRIQQSAGTFTTLEKSVPPVVATPERANSWTGGAVVVLSSVMMMLVALMLWNEPTPRPGPKKEAGVPSETNGEANTADRNQPEPAPLDSLRHDGKGPVELRPRLPHVGTGDPDKPEFPELDIEVFPLYPKAERNKGPEQRSLPESGSLPKDPHPMPEEERSLPESRSPGSQDVDEEETVPLLPELRSQPPAPLGI